MAQTWPLLGELEWGIDPAEYLEDTLKCCAGSQKEVNKCDEVDEQLLKLPEMTQDQSLASVPSDFLMEKVDSDRVDDTAVDVGDPLTEPKDKTVVVKRKNGRMRLSCEQKQLLLEAYERQVKGLDVTDYSKLANETKIPVKKVRSWFSRRRCLSRKIK